MNMKTKLIVLGVFAIVLTACGNRQKTEGKVIYDTVPHTQITIATEYYFAGEYMYMADAAVLKEEATGLILPIAMQEVFPEAVKQYKAAEPESGEYIYAVFHGYLTRKGADEEGPEDQLVLTYVVGFDKNQHNEAYKNLVNTYRMDNNVLVLASDHTFMHTRDNRTYNGKWFLASDNQMVLMSDTANSLIDIDYEAGTLTTVEASPIVYRR